MHHNEDGLAASEHAVVDLHGESTDIHSNTRYGIYALHRAKVQIHFYLHNTTHRTTTQNQIELYMERWHSTIANVK